MGGTLYPAYIYAGFSVGGTLYPAYIYGRDHIFVSIYTPVPR